MKDCGKWWSHHLYQKWLFIPVKPARSCEFQLFHRSYYEFDVYRKK